ncbi:MAG: Major facilitator superfamily [Parcubacteria group bacterium GW2011_GWA1_47_10]|nr:MAG: Major facilitator superfamily [Parcubacteria group bacterium GW2011_GWA1_47_10]
MNKRLFLWALYDFANSFVLMGFLFYFSQWLVFDQGKPAWWYNAALVLSSALFIISAPIISKKIDATGLKMGGLRLWTLFSFLAYLGTAILAMTTDGQEIAATTLFTLASYAYLVCFLYFTPMLNDLSDEHDRSSKSGIGQGANSIGQVAGVLVTLPFVNGITLFGDPGRAQALLPATLIFGLLALPMLLLYKENKIASKDSAGHTGQSPDMVSLFKEVFKNKSLALLLLGYFLVSDVMLTFANNFPLYLEAVFGTEDTLKSILTAGILTLAAVGAVIFGKIADKKGGLRVLKNILVVWCFILLTMSFVENFRIALPIFLFAGLLFGPVWAISRALVGHYSPPHLVASSYSYYVVAELMLLVIVSWFVLNKIKAAQ